MEALEVFLAVALLLLSGAVLTVNALVPAGLGPVPWIARRFGIKVEPKGRSDIWSLWFRR